MSPTGLSGELKILEQCLSQCKHSVNVSHQDSSVVISTVVIGFHKLQMQIGILFFFPEEKMCL